jgi:hypothetical protein
MEFSEAQELNDLLKLSPVTRSRQVSNKSSMSLLESMMNSGLDIESTGSLSPVEFRFRDYSTGQVFQSETVEPDVKEDEPKAELDQVAIQVVKDENFRESYAQSLYKTSSLTESLKNSLFERPEVGLKVLIHLFDRKDKLKVTFPKKTTVEQLVPRIISAYSRDDRFKSTPLPCGPVAEAYEVRMIDDTDMVIEKTMKVKDLDVDALSLIVNQSYLEAQKHQTDNLGDPSGKLVKVYYEKQCNNVRISPSSHVRSILEKLGVKYGYLSPDEFEFKLVISLEDLTQQECDISLDMPVSSLVTDELKLYRKVYVDTPTFIEKRQEKIIPIKREEEEDVNYNSSRQPMSFAQAIAYKEYEVIKTNTRGKRQKRILGISQFRLSNMTVEQAKKAKIKEKALEKSEKNILKNKILSWYESKAHHPEIPMSSIHSVEQDLKNLRVFYIDYTEGKTRKKRAYETEKSSITVEIITKLKILTSLVRFI